MAVLKNRVGVLTGTTGIGVITLGAAIGAGVAPFPAKWQTFTQGGVVNGDSVRYLILDNAEWEYGPGIWTSASNTLARAAGAMDGSVAGQKSSTNALLALSGSAQVFLTAVAEDLTAFAQLASPAFTGNPTAPTAAPGDNDTSIATTAFTQSAIDAKAVRYDAAQGLSAAAQKVGRANIAAQTLHGIGQCYLQKGINTTDPLTLKPENGNLLWINGALETIPDAGVSLAPTGNAALTLYYIYAFMSGGVMTLEYSTTAYAVQAGTGVKIKSGDATRTLVGMSCTTGAASTWTAFSTELVSLFNPKNKSYIVPVAADLATTSTSLTSISSAYDIRFVTFGDREVLFKLYGRVAQTVSTAAAYLDAVLDSALPYVFVNSQAASMRSQPGVAVGNWDWMYGEVTFFVAVENQRHMITPVYATSTGTVTFNGGDSLTIQG